MDQIAELDSEGLMINQKKMEFEFIFCSDWKFLSLMIGIKAATSVFFCPWCLCAKEYRSCLLEDWEKFPRNWESSENKCYDCSKQTCDNPTHDDDPLTPSLLTKPFSRDNCVLDTLHCLLRTSELLETILIEIGRAHV